MADNPVYDVLIGGGGLAGQCLARQLKLARPRLSVAVIDWEKRPLPEAAFKVGEATSELGAHYFAEKLRLKDYLQRDQLLKCGLRFFFGDAQGPIVNRPEYGPRLFPPITSYQLDRGKLENDLRQLNESLGVTLWEGFAVEDIVLGEGDAPHTTVLRERTGGSARAIRSTWVVDCTGRQRVLQNKLGLGLPSPLQHSACWFRVSGKCDISDLVPRDATEWHDRVPGGVRYHSTNHLVGTGYWVWLIPLSSGNTSVGIVVDERIHPVATINTCEKAQAWLEAHEPVVARHVARFEVMDFKHFRQFSYDTRQFFSTNRWACIGEAAAFLDPFYSPGSDFIGMANTAVTKLISRHFDQSLTRAVVEQADATLLQLHRAFTEVFLDQYPTFGHSRVMTAKVIWDNASYWVFVCQMFFQDILLDDEYLDHYRRVFEEFYQLNKQVQQLFRDWARESKDSGGYDYLGYVDFPIAVRSHLELGTKKSPRRFLDWIEVNLNRFSAWAVVLFRIAVEDVAPEALDKIPEERLTPELVDLRNMDRAITATRSGTRAGTGRNRLAPEIASLKRQMTKLFPGYTCLQERAGRRPADMAVAAMSTRH